MTIASTLRTDALSIVTGELVSGKWIDISDANRSITNNGGTSFTDATLGRLAMRFDADTDYAQFDETDEDIFPTSGFGVAFWRRKLDATNRQGYVFGLNSTNNAFDCYVNAPWIDGDLYFRFGSDADAYIDYTPTGIDLTEWHHFVCHISGSPGKLQVYMDGTLLFEGNSGTFSRSVDSVKSFRINGTGSPHTGDRCEIADIVFLDRAFTVPEIAYLADESNQLDTVSATGIGGERFWICPTLDSLVNGQSAPTDLSGNLSSVSFVDTETGDLIDDTTSGGTKAIVFGAGEYTDLGELVTVSAGSDFTFAAWVKPTWLGSNPGMFRAWDGVYPESGAAFGIFQGSTGRPWIRVNSVDVLKPESGTAVSSGVWQHIVFRVKSAVDASFWIDGVKAHEASHAVAVVEFSLRQICHQSRISVQEQVAGPWDDYRFYDRALSDTEIGQLSSTRGYEPSSTIIGSSNVTDENDTGEIVGSVSLDGASSVTDASDEGTHVGSVLVAGDSTNTDESDSGTIEGGYSELFGSSSSTDDNDTGSITGIASLDGSSTNNDGDDVGTHEGSVLVVGSSTVTDEDDTGTIEAEMFGTFGSSTKTDASDSGSATGSVAQTGSSTATDADDVGDAVGSVFGTFGDSTKTDATDGGTATGEVQLTGSSSTTDADDTGVATATNELSSQRGFMPQGMFVRSRFKTGMNVGA